MPIPRVLHQTWRSTSLPTELAAWRQTWLDHHPAWTHVLWDDAAVRGFVAAEFPDWLDVHDTLARPVQRADLFRYLVLYARGGLYADVDMIAYRPSDTLIDGATCVLSIEAHLGRRRQSELGYRHPYQLANCILAATAGHPFLGRVLDALRDAVSRPPDSDDAVEDTTGPRLLTRVAQDLPREVADTVRVLPQIHWMAPWEVPRIGPLERAIHARHVAMGSWRTEEKKGWNRRWIERNRVSWWRAERL